MNTSIVQHDPVILRLIQASTALTEAKSIQQTKSILDVAAAAEIYAKRQQLGEDSIGIARSIKIEALRKLGEMLKETPRAKSVILRGTKMEPRENEPPTLAELGLDKKTSSIAQKLAELPEKAFEQVRDGHETVAKAIAAISETRQRSKPTPPQEPPTDETQELRAHIAELTATAKELLEENASMGAVMDADDKLAALTAENKRLRELNRVLNERIQGLQGERNEAKRAAKMWRAKFDKLEKLAV